VLEAAGIPLRLDNPVLEPARSLKKFLSYGASLSKHREQSNETLEE
jgi:hypothetical protein